MKKEFAQRPETFIEQWPGELTGHGSWHGSLVGMPSPLFVVTSYKSNGKQNACFQSRSTFTENNGEFYFLLGWVPTGNHMYQSLKETGCCVLNFPTRDLMDKCWKTIHVNQFDTNEITEAGLTAEPATSVNAPRIAECFLNIECEFVWERELAPGDSSCAVACVKAVHVCMDSDYYNENKTGRYGKTGFVFSSGSRNPDTGEIYDGGFSGVEVYQ